MLDDVKNFINLYLIQVLIGVIIFLLSITLYLWISLYFTSQERDEYMVKVEAIRTVSKKERERYKKEIDSYNDAINSIVDYYEDEKTNIDNFTRRVDETDCDAAYRFFNRSRF